MGNETGRRRGRFSVSFQALCCGAILSVLVAAGCGSDPTDPPVPVLEFPATPDELIATFRDAFENRELGTIESLLAPGFVFYFAPLDVDSFQVAPDWGSAEELRSYERLFEGETGVWPSGEKRAPIDPIFPFGTQVRAVDETEWETDGDTGWMTRPFTAAMVIQYLDGCIDVVSGTQVFAALDMATVGGPNGEPATGYALRSWRDLGLNGLGSEPESQIHVASWGYVKACFRELN